MKILESDKIVEKQTLVGSGADCFWISPESLVDIYTEIKKPHIEMINAQKVMTKVDDVAEPFLVITWFITPDSGKSLRYSALRSAIPISDANHIPSLAHLSPRAHVLESALCVSFPEIKFQSQGERHF